MPLLTRNSFASYNPNGIVYATYGVKFINLSDRREYTQLQQPSGSVWHITRQNVWEVDISFLPVINFTDLGDVPNSYSGHTLEYVRVNSAGTGLEFVAGTGSQDLTSVLTTGNDGGGIGIVNVPSLGDSTSITSIDIQNRQLINSTGLLYTLDWNNRITVDSSGQNSIDWENRTLIDNVLATKFNWQTLTMPSLGGSGTGVVGVDNSGNLSWTAATSLSLETDGTPNGSQTLLNLKSGTNITLTDNGLGMVTIDAATSGVVSVSGTLNRVTSTGGANPVIDIDAAYDALWQPKHLNLTSLSGLTFVSTSFVKMTGVNTFALDTSTYQTSLTGVQGDLIYFSGVNTIANLNKDTNATRYLSNQGVSNNPSWNQVNLANGVTGDLPFANLTQGTARSVLGITGNSTADFASIQGTTDQVLRVDTAGTGLSFGTVATGGITNNAVTYAKMQAISTTSKLLGSSTTTTPVQEITIGAGLTLTGTTLTASAGATIYVSDGTLTGNRIVDISTFDLFFKDAGNLGAYIYNTSGSGPVFNEQGLILDFVNRVYYLGDPNLLGNGTSITVDDTLATVITLAATKGVVASKLALNTGGPATTNLEVNGTLKFTTGNEGTNKFLKSDASGNADWDTVSVAWANVTGTPTTLSGYGITDALSNSATSTQDAHFGDIFLKDDTVPSHYLGITWAENETVSDRTLSLKVNAGSRTIDLSGNLTVPSAATVSGTNTGDQTSVSGNAGSASTVSTSNEATDTTCFVAFFTASGTQTLEPKNNTNLTFDSSAAKLGSTIFNAATGFRIGDAAASGKFLVGDGTNYIASTSTIPTSAGATTNKWLKSDGTNYVLSTSTLSDAPSTALKWLRSDGTNWITSTSTLAEGGVTARKILVSDATNWVASTETWAVPGTAGNLLISDGTNWISAAHYQYGIVTNDRTSTSTTLADVTDLAAFSLAAGKTYSFKFSLYVTTNATTVGILCTVNNSSAVTSINFKQKYPTSATAWVWEQNLTTLQGGTLSTAGPGATVVEYLVDGQVVANTAGTFALQFKSETGAAVVVKKGSWGEVIRVN